MSEPVAKKTTVDDLTQKEQVLWHLRNKGPLDKVTAMQEYQIGRLAARVHELREAGHEIVTIKTDPFGTYALEGQQSLAFDE